MRTLILIAFAVLARPASAQACELFFGAALKVDALKPGMIVDVRPLPLLDAADDVPPTAVAPDDYLESEGVRGRMIVREVKFRRENLVEVELISVDDLVETDLKNFKPKDGSSKRISYGYDYRKGALTRAWFRLVGHAEGDGEYYWDLRSPG